MRASVRLPSIDGLSAFEASARLGSFERAAQELHITASAVSKRVATLEDLLGGQVLHRGPKALSLTTLGKDYLEHVRHVLDLLAAMPQHQRVAQRREKLVLNALPTFARKLLMPRLYDYLDEHPEVDIEVVTTIPYLDVAAVEAHLEVRHGKLTGGAQSPLMSERVIPVATPELLRQMAPRRAADLLSAPLIRCPLEPWTPWLQAAGCEAVEPSGGPRFVDVGLMMEAAVLGRGVALARPSLVREWLRNGALVPVWPVAAATPPQYFLAHPPRTDTAVRFASWLAGICVEAADEGLALVSRLCGENFRVV